MTEHSYMIEYEITKQCNLKCSYCFESGCFENKHSNIDDDFIQFVKKVKKDINSKICITFWGGEPTLNMTSIRNVYNAFKDDDTTTFMVYTNGYDIDEFISFIKNECNPKAWLIQVSYDGKYLQDIYRPSIDDTLTSSKVLSSFYKLCDTGARITIKSTLPINGFNNFFNSWKEFEYIHDNLISNHIDLDLGYQPTICGTPTKESILIFEDEVKKIFNAEYKRCSIGKMPILRWLNAENDMTCSNGEEYICVSMTGNVFPCHGALYSDDISELIISNIYKSDVINDLVIGKNKFHNAKCEKNKKCIGCSALNCQICNITEYDHSDKDSFNEKISDKDRYTHCIYNKIYGKYGRIFLKLVNGLKIEV